MSNPKPKPRRKPRRKSDKVEDFVAVATKVVQSGLAAYQAIKPLLKRKK